MTFETPQAAEAAFYEAFSALDLDAMMSVWVPRDDIVCIHPMSARLTGQEAIRASWAQIFQGDGSMRFELGEPIYLTNDTLSVHYVFEEISFGRDFQDQSRISATNIYLRTDDGWGMHAHHGSPGVAAARPSPPRPAGQTVH